jgi:hypothetical protein
MAEEVTTMRVGGPEYPRRVLRELGAGTQYEARGKLRLRAFKQYRQAGRCLVRAILDPSGLDEARKNLADELPVGDERVQHPLEEDEKIGTVLSGIVLEMRDMAGGRDIDLNLLALKLTR